MGLKELASYTPWIAVKGNAALEGREFGNSSVELSEGGFSFMHDDMSPPKKRAVLDRVSVVSGYVCFRMGFLKARS